MKIKILTWNINHRKNVSGLWNYVAKVSPDVVLFQESTHDHYLEKNADFDGFFDEASGLAIYSKFSVSKLDIEIPFRIVAANVLAGDGRLTMVNIHNYPGYAGDYTVTLNRILDSLEGFIKEFNNLIIGGDMNVGLYYDRKYMETCNAEVLNRVESFGFARYPAKEEQTHRHNRYMNVPYPDDFIFIDKRLKIIGYEVLSNPEVMALSDHNPVVVEIEV